MALDNKGIMYQLLYKYINTHSLPYYKGQDLGKELESFAWEGFFEACRNWDEGKGYTLSTYAWPAIINALNARMKVLERMGTNMQGHYNKGEGGRPRPGLSSLEGLDERKAKELTDGDPERSLADIYTQPWQGHEPGLEDSVIDAIEQAETLERIREIASGMSEPHKEVFTLMYLTPPTHDRNLLRGLGTGYTLEEVARHLGKSTSWVKVVLHEALDYIRFQLRARGMDED